MIVTLRRLLVASSLLLGVPLRALAGQDSQFGIAGLGTPGRSESVRSRATGGALGPFDALSAIDDAALAAADRLTVTTGSAASYRSLEFPGERTWLRATRFPILGIAGPVGHAIIVGGGFTTYLDKSYALSTRDTVMIRGAPVPVTDRFTSDGAVADLRAAVATRLSDRLAVGAGLHLLTGSTRVRAARDFSDSAYASTFEAAEIAYDGFGVSAGLAAAPMKSVHLSVFLRSDTRLRAREGGQTLAENDLPTTVGGSLAWQVGPGALLAASVVRRSWSSAGANAYDVVNWSVGGELGRAGGTPLRLGVRGGRMPFGPGGQAPREFGIAGGTGATFSEGRGILDLTLEHLSRTGVGLRERVWTLLLGVTVRP